ncbi:hypothetical protein QYF36_008905 [Acer negundo]|nr:hypothetical protein QYF36_008905 [Acer negundo]
MLTKAGLSLPLVALKLNVDAAMDVDKGKYEVGIMFMDDRGGVIEAATLSFIAHSIARFAVTVDAQMFGALIFLSDSHC